MYFKNLFEPISVGGLEVRNRLVMPGMHTNLGGADVGVSEKGIDFAAARAKGGFGMVCVGIIDSYPWEFTSEDDYLLRTDRHVENHARAADAIREHGAVPYAQIGPRRVWPLGDLFTREHRLSELDASTIEEMVEATVETAVRADRAGYEAIDLLGNGAGAMAFFMSRRFNDREDEWGGSVERQLEFPRRVIRGIRDELGDVPLFYRLIGDEFLPDGHDVATVRAMAAALEEAGIDFFNVTGGSHATSVPQLPANVPRGAFAYLAREIRSAVDVPVAASNRINDPVTAERLVRDGWADMISLGRGALADPEWPNKAREGRLEDVNLCIACNECLDIATVKEEDIRCLVNPKAGRGLEAATIPPAEDPKTVLVAGGGVVGMHAALACDERGHDVTLVEESDVLGGKWRVSYAPRGREELFHYLRWLTTQLRKSDVTVELETPATPELVRARAPDVLLGCFGGVPQVPPIPGVEADHVHYVHEVLDGDVEIEADRVAVIGGGGAGVEGALYLATKDADEPATAMFLHRWDVIDREAVFDRVEAGHDVTVIGRNDTVGVGLGASTKWVLRAELRKLGVDIRAGTAATAVLEDGVRIEDESGEEEFVPAGAVVLATGYDTPDSLADEFAGTAPEVHFVGDVVDPDHAIEGTGRVQELALEL